MSNIGTPLDTLITSKTKEVTDLLNNGTYGLNAIRTLANNAAINALNAYNLANNGTNGLVAIKNAINTVNNNVAASMIGNGAVLKYATYSLTGNNVNITIPGNIVSLVTISSDSYNYYLTPTINGVKYDKIYVGRYSSATSAKYDLYIGRIIGENILSSGFKMDGKNFAYKYSNANNKVFILTDVASGGLYGNVFIPLLGPTTKGITIEQTGVSYAGTVTTIHVVYIE